jgi:glutamate synthase (NADPH/NADH) small chain
MDELIEPSGCFSARRVHPEARKAEGSHEILRRFAPQDEGSHSSKNSPTPHLIDAKDKRVVVIGGGDTGADCVGVAHRQKAKSVLQIELLPKPPQARNADFPWPKYPLILKTSTSHQEGGERLWSVLTKKFSAEAGSVKKLSCVRLDFEKGARGELLMKEVPGSEFEVEADLVILALGFLHPEKQGLLEELGVELDSRGNVKTGENFMSSHKAVFACGDMRCGQSLVVWAIAEGRQAAQHINEYLV